MDNLQLERMAQMIYNKLKFLRENKEEATTADWARIARFAEVIGKHAQEEYDAADYYEYFGENDN